MKFRLLAGIHVQSHPKLKNPDGSPVDVRYRPGDVVESDADLAAIFNPKTDKGRRDPNRPRKFERLPDNYVAPAEQPFQPEEPDKPPVNLDAMDLKGLLQLAEEEEINLKGVNKGNREQVLKALKGAFSPADMDALSTKV